MKVGKRVVLALSLAVSMSAFADDGGGTIGSGTRAEEGGGTIGSGTLSSDDDGGLVGSIGGKEEERGLIGSGTRSGIMGSGNYFGSGLALVQDAFGNVYLVISDGVTALFQALD